MIARYYFADNADGDPTVYRQDGSPVASFAQMSAEAWNLLVLGVVTEQARPHLSPTTEGSAS